MQLPLANPPANTTIRQSGSEVVVTRELTTNPFAQRAKAITLGAVALFVIVTGLRVAVSGVPALDVLLSPLTLGTLLLLGVPAVLASKIGERQRVVEWVVLKPGSIEAVKRRYGIEEREVAEKSRIIRLIRSRPRNPDGSLYGGGSVEIEYRGDGGKSKELHVMYSLTQSDEEVEWYIRVLEAWSGMRARAEEFVIDPEDDEEEDRDEDDFGHADEGEGGVDGRGGADSR